MCCAILHCDAIHRVHYDNTFILLLENVLAVAIAGLEMLVAVRAHVHSNTTLTSRSRLLPASLPAVSRHICGGSHVAVTPSAVIHHEPPHSSIPLGICCTIQQMDTFVRCPETTASGKAAHRRGAAGKTLRSVIWDSPPRMSCPRPILHCRGPFLARLESNTELSVANFGRREVIMVEARVRQRVQITIRM